jgi:hypothetical protein
MAENSLYIVALLASLVAIGYIFKNAKTIWNEQEKIYQDAAQRRGDIPPRESRGAGGSQKGSPKEQA